MSTTSGIASLFKKRAEQTENQSVNSNGNTVPTDLPRNSHLPGTSSGGAATIDSALPGRLPIPTPESDPPVNSSSTTSRSNHPPSLHLSVPLPPIRVIAPRVERLFQTFGLGPIPQSVHDLLHFFDKHPGLRGMKDGITQIFEFGGCLLDPRGLIARYEKMQRWGSDQTAGPYGRGWVNLWTTPVPRSEAEGRAQATKTGHLRHRNATSASLALSSTDSAWLHAKSRGHPVSAYSTSSEHSLDASSSGLSLFQNTTFNLSPSTTLTSFESIQYELDRQIDPEVASDKRHGQSSPGNSSRTTRERHQPQPLIPKARKKSADKHLDAVSRVERQQRKEVEKQEKRAEKERRAFLKGVAKRAQSKNQEFSSKPFIVLPRAGTDHQWVRTPVVGAEDEIVAHCGLFIRNGNPGYSQLIENVGDIVRSFWDGEGGLRHSRGVI